MITKLEVILQTKLRIPTVENKIEIRVRNFNSFINTQKILHRHTFFTNVFHQHHYSPQLLWRLVSCLFWLRSYWPVLHLPRFHRIIIIDSETKTGQNWKGMFVLIFWQSKRILWLISFETCTVKFILQEVLKRNNFWKRRTIPNYCTFHLFFWFLYVQTFHNINISLKNA